MALVDFFFGPRIPAGVGDHIRTLAKMCGDKDALIAMQKSVIDDLGEDNDRLERAVCSTAVTVRGLLNIIHSNTLQSALVDDTDPLFMLIFNLDERIAIKRAKQLLEDAAE